MLSKHPLPAYGYTRIYIYLTLFRSQTFISHHQHQRKLIINFTTIGLDTVFRIYSQILPFCAKYIFAPNI